MGTGAYHRRPQFTLYAYVCGAGCVQHPDVEGTISFMQVFLKRPPKCRYAIVGEWSVVEHKEQILVWDLDATRQQIKGKSKIIPPEPLRVCVDVDQAIMSTLMLYEND